MSPPPATIFGGFLTRIWGLKNIRPLSGSTRALAPCRPTDRAQGSLQPTRGPRSLPAQSDCSEECEPATWSPPLATSSISSYLSLFRLRGSCARCSYLRLVSLHSFRFTSSAGHCERHQLGSQQLPSLHTLFAPAVFQVRRGFFVQAPQSALSRLAHFVDERRNLAPLLGRSGRLAAVFESVLVGLRCLRRWPAVHPGPAVRHPRRLTELAASGSRTASRGSLNI